MNYQLFFDVDEKRKGKSFIPMQTVPPPFVPVGILHKGKTLNFTVDEFDELLRSGLNKEVDNFTSTNTTKATICPKCGSENVHKPIADVGHHCHSCHYQWSGKQQPFAERCRKLNLQSVVVRRKRKETL